MPLRPGESVSSLTLDVNELEDDLGRLQALVRGPNAGLFGPSSQVWRVNRHAVVFLGAGRAALLQLAHPSVANAIDRWSGLRQSPIRRFQNTFTNVFAMVFGDLDLALRASRQVYAVHARIPGALDQDAALWVHSTLWETSVRVFELTVRPLSSDEKSAYYEETKRFASLFAIPRAALPSDWPAFEAYNRQMWASTELRATRAAREIAELLFSPPLPGLRPLMRWYRIMTAGLMPKRLRGEFGLSFERARERATFVASIRLLRGESWLPPRLRYLPAYIDARRRLAGELEPDWLGQRLNRVLVGRRKQV